MKLEKLNLDDCKLTKVQLSNVKGGTSATEFTQTGVSESEQELDSDGKKIGKPILVDMPI